MSRPRRTQCILYWTHWLGNTQRLQIGRLSYSLPQTEKDAACKLIITASKAAHKNSSSMISISRTFFLWQQDSKTPNFFSKFQYFSEQLLALEDFSGLFRSRGNPESKQSYACAFWWHWCRAWVAEEWFTDATLCYSSWTLCGSWRLRVLPFTEEWHCLSAITR